MFRPGEGCSMPMDPGNRAECFDLVRDAACRWSQETGGDVSRGEGNGMPGKCGKRAVMDKTGYGMQRARGARSRAGMFRPGEGNGMPGNGR